MHNLCHKAVNVGAPNTGYADRNIRMVVKAELAQYKGKYVLLRGKEVVLSGENLKELVQEFKARYPGETPTIAKIPKDEVLVWNHRWNSLPLFLQDQPALRHTHTGLSQAAAETLNNLVSIY